MLNKLLTAFCHIEIEQLHACMVTLRLMSSAIFKPIERGGLADTGTEIHLFELLTTEQLLVLDNVPDEDLLTGDDDILDWIRRSTVFQSSVRSSVHLNLLSSTLFQ